MSVIISSKPHQPNMVKPDNKKQSLHTSLVLLAILAALTLTIYSNLGADAKEYKKEHPQKGNLCIARFETSGEPLYYTCPRPNESEKKSYCCFLDKCCDFKEFQKQQEQQFKMTQGSNYGSYMGKNLIGSALKFILWIILFIIALIVGCCCLTFFLCRKKKLFQGGIFNSPLPAQPPGPSPYAPPANPYMAYQWPPETTPAPPPAYPTPSYPPYPSTNSGPPQPPYNPGFK